MPSFTPIRPFQHQLGAGNNQHQITETLTRRTQFRQPVEQEYLAYLRRVESALGTGNTMNDKLDDYGFNNLKAFRGSYPYNVMPELKNGQSCLVNQDRAGQPGVHWFAVCKSRGKLYGYDSFGRKMDNYIHKKVINDTIDREQLVKQNNCGQRSLAFIHVFEKHGIKKALQI